MRRIGTAVAAVWLAAALPGCGGRPAPPARPAAPPTASATASEDAADIAAERAKLSPEDQKLVDAQEWCAISSDERLGAMGPPIKLDVKGRPVFICCGGCQKKALADPDKTLAKVEELTAKKRLDAAGK